MHSMSPLHIVAMFLFIGLILGVLIEDTFYALILAQAMSNVYSLVSNSPKSLIYALCRYTLTWMLCLNTDLPLAAISQHTVCF